MYYIYIIKRQGKSYIGYTNNLIRRLKEHKARQPDLVYYEAYKDRRDARFREKILKQRGQTIRRLKERLKYSFK